MKGRRLHPSPLFSVRIVLDQETSPCSSSCSQEAGPFHGSIEGETAARIDILI